MTTYAHPQGKIFNYFCHPSHWVWVYVEALSKATAGKAKVDWEVTLAVLQDALSDAPTIQDIFKKVGRVLRASGSQCVPNHCKGALKQAATAIAETSLDPLLVDEAQEFRELLDLHGGKAQKSQVQKHRVNIHDVDPDDLKERWASIAQIPRGITPENRIELGAPPAAAPMIGTALVAGTAHVGTSKVCGMVLDPAAAPMQLDPGPASKLDLNPNPAVMQLDPRAPSSKKLHTAGSSETTICYSPGL